MKASEIIVGGIHWTLGEQVTEADRIKCKRCDSEMSASSNPSGVCVACLQNVGLDWCRDCNHCRSGSCVSPLCANRDAARLPPTGWYKARASSDKARGAHTLGLLNKAVDKILAEGNEAALAADARELFAAGNPTKTASAVLPRVGEIWKCKHKGVVPHRILSVRPECDKIDTQPAIAPPGTPSRSYSALSEFVRDWRRAVDCEEGEPETVA